MLTPGTKGWHLISTITKVGGHIYGSVWLADCEFLTEDHTIKEYLNWKDQRIHAINLQREDMFPAKIYNGAITDAVLLEDLLGTDELRFHNILTRLYGIQTDINYDTFYKYMTALQQAVDKFPVGYKKGK